MIIAMKIRRLATPVKGAIASTVGIIDRAEKMGTNKSTHSVKVGARENI